jgi:hypothetical protein
MHTRRGEFDISTRIDREGNHVFWFKTPGYDERPPPVSAENTLSARGRFGSNTSAQHVVPPCRAHRWLDHVFDSRGHPTLAPLRHPARGTLEHGVDGIGIADSVDQRGPRQ